MNSDFSWDPSSLSWLTVVCRNSDSGMESKLPIVSACGLCAQYLDVEHKLPIEYPRLD